MWLLYSLAALAATVLLHAGACRIPGRLPVLHRFLLMGLPIGFVLIAVEISAHGVSYAAAAGVFFYAAACEVYIFLFQSATKSLSWQAIVLLSREDVAIGQLEAEVGGSGQFSPRVANLVADGLVSRDTQEPTERGRKVARLLRRLRQVFNRPAPLPHLAAPAVAERLEFSVPVVSGLGRRDLAALAAIASVTLFLFWPYLTGQGVFVGDSDRMNHHVALLGYLAEGLREGGLRTWNDALFGGYSTAALPYAYPNPFYLIALLWPPEEIYQSAAFASAMVLGLSGATAYFFLRDLTQERASATLGAALYACSALPVRMIGGSDTSSFVFFLMPLMLLSIRRIDRSNAGRCFAGLTLVIAAMLVFSFLQWAAYICLFGGCYALWLSFVRRSWHPTLVTAWAGVAAAVLATPRIVDTGYELVLSGRESRRAFSDMFGDVRVRGYELLRVLDDRVFGKDFSQTLPAGNFMNLHEGILVYASTFAAILLLWAVSRAFWVWATGPRLDRCPADGPFFLVALVVVFLVPMTWVGYYIVHSAFLGGDFMHARIFVLAPLAYAALIALCLGRSFRDGPPLTLPSIMLVAPVAAAVILAIEATAAAFEPKTVTVALAWLTHNKLALFQEALVRIAASSVLALAVLVAAQRLDPARRPILMLLFAFLMVGQAAVYAAGQIGGEHMRASGVPFQTPARLRAEPGQFRAPTSQARSAMAEKLEPERYRTAIVCLKQTRPVYCAPHVASFWRLRAIEGYVSSVPSRLLALPWDPQAIGRRSISFDSFDRLQWKLLGLYNVRYAIGYNTALATNAVPDGPGPAREASPTDMRIVENPFPVTPRAFLAARVRSASAYSGESGAAAAMFPGGRLRPDGYDLAAESVVEDFRASRAEYSSEGSIRARFRAQRVEVEISPLETPRFLVLNELYHPRWRAYAEGRELRIYPTNLIMRGVEVPPHARQVSFRYEPFAASGLAAAAYFGAFALFAAGCWFFGRTTGRTRERAA
jgi:hypothetical protein